MARTMFVNPSFVNPRRKRGRKSKRRASKGRRYHKRSRRRSSGRRYSVTVRRNAGITPFIQNPLILSNPRRRHRRRRKNPLSLPDAGKLLETMLSCGGGAAAALTVNTVGTGKIKEPWIRRSVQAAVAGIGGAMISQKSNNMGAAFTGAMFFPLFADIASDLLGVGVAVGTAVPKEADIEALAADLEDVMDEMDDDGGDYGDDDDDDDGEEEW